MVVSWKLGCRDLRSRRNGGKESSVGEGEGGKGAVSTHLISRTLVADHIVRQLPQLVEKLWRNNNRPGLLYPAIKVSL